MASYLILGAGKFGRLALTRLADQDPEARFLIVDRRGAALEEALALGFPGNEMLETDAIRYLAAHLAPEFTWDWLVPMVPVHVAYAWLRQGPLAGTDWEPMEVPGELEGLGAFAVRGPEGELYLSQARHLCPDDCAEPAVCPVTGEDRDPPLFLRLSEAPLKGVRILVVASQQLAPGVGGYAPRRLLELSQAVARSDDPVLVATACRCHGVIHGLRRKQEGYA